VFAARAQHLNFVGQENARRETFGARPTPSSISRLPLLGPVRHRHPQSSSHLSRVLCLRISTCSYPLLVASRVSRAFYSRQRSKPTVASRPNVASRLYACPFSTHGLAPSSRTRLHRRHSFIHNNLVILHSYCDKPSTVLGRLVRSLPKP
jgi:hypothetical protein